MYLHIDTVCQQIYVQASKQTDRKMAVGGKTGTERYTDSCRTHDRFIFSSPTETETDSCRM